MFTWYWEESITNESKFVWKIQHLYRVFMANREHTKNSSALLKFSGLALYIANFDIKSAQIPVN